MDLQTDNYHLGYARFSSDVEAAQRLRYNVFNIELGEGLNESKLACLDADRFDAVCDHLVVR
ncbi:MAG TPA: GNAT family N-acyltransferase, partial [Opitutaceae bacterium]|nr:GNAT family N-acyltransferase [Opitutaceae bacterium]